MVVEDLGALQARRESQMVQSRGCGDGFDSEGLQADVCRPFLGRVAGREAVPG